MDCIILDSDKEWRTKLGKQANKPDVQMRHYQGMNCMAISTVRNG